MVLLTFFTKKSLSTAALQGGRLVRWLLTSLLLMLLVAASQPGAMPEAIELKVEKLPFEPTEFYFADVVEERSERRAVAWLLPLGEEAAKANPAAIDLKGGGLGSIKHFIRQSLPQNTALRPVVVRLQECRISESPGEAGRIAGRIVVRLAFDLKQGDLFVPLTTYEGGVRYSRDNRTHNVVEPALRQSLSKALLYFHEWIGEEARTNEKLAKGVKVFFSDYSSQAEGDTVFYQPDRPLQWEDFKGAPSRTSRFAATVFPTFAYAGSSEVVDGWIHLNLQMKVFVLKENSWVKERTKDAYGLNHEQRHFDLVKLVTERFKQKIQAEQYPIADYSGLIAAQYIHFFREMNKVQEAYDSETRHGLDQLAQERWNRKIDGELRDFGIIR